MLRFSGRLHCPRFAAWLENLQKELIRTGHSGIAELIPAL
jgi:hypothetical protein